MLLYLLIEDISLFFCKQGLNFNNSYYNKIVTVLIILTEFVYFRKHLMFKTNIHFKHFRFLKGCGIYMFLDPLDIDWRLEGVMSVAHELNLGLQIIHFSSDKKSGGFIVPEEVPLVKYNECSVYVIDSSNVSLILYRPNYFIFFKIILYKYLINELKIYILNLFKTSIQFLK